MCAGLRKALSSEPSRKVAFSHCPLAGGMLGKGQLFRRVKGRLWVKLKGCPHSGCSNRGCSHRGCSYRGCSHRGCSHRGAHTEVLTQGVLTQGVLTHGVLTQRCSHRGCSHRGCSHRGCLHRSAHTCPTATHLEKPLSLGAIPGGSITQQTFLPQEQPAPPAFPLPTCLFLSTSGIISQPSPSTVHKAEQGASPESRVTDRHLHLGAPAPL